jgi:transposase
VATISKSEYATIAALYRNGISGAEIAREYGVTRERIRQIITANYPNDLQERKHRMAENRRRKETCVCGSKKASSSSQCVDCASRARKVWTADLIVERMKEFNSKYGRGPAATDFSPALARQRNEEVRARRFEGDKRYPSTTTVVGMFGSWNKAMDAAGLEKNKRGRPAGVKKNTLV